MIGRGRLRTGGRAGALLILGLLVALLAGELLLRALQPQLLLFDTSRIWEPAAEVGYRRRAQLDVIVNTGERDARILSDAAGHRVAATPPAAGGIRILAVGDSMVEALQVNYDDTMTAQLERALSRRLGTTVQVVNAGVGGYDPNQYAATVTRELGRASYSLALVFVYLDNDIIDRRVASYPPTTRFNPPPLQLETLALRAEVYLRRHSHLFVFAQNRIELWRIRSGVRQRHLLATSLKANAAADDWGITADILAGLAQEAASHGTPVRFVLLPPAHFVDPVLLETYMWAFGVDAPDVDIAQPARRVTSELEARGLHVFDATPGLAAAFAAGAHDLYGRVDPHLSPSGHTVIARLLEPVAADYLAAGVRDGESNGTN